ncbi:MAG: DedA family protein [Candidatus Pacebacteria bacterium]|jgi:membrane protein DedA with SNARE-associated domain|nr:DedA family protein [Candidatus Paceibacterota bacterium]
MDNITIETLIQGGSYLAIFLLMIANGAVSFPSSQVLYIIAGYFIARGDLAVGLVALAGALGNTVGNVILYELARKHGRTFIERMKIFPTRELAKVEKAFQKKGAWFIFIGKLLPAIKVFVPIPAGLGKMSRPLFASLMFVASFIWSLAFISIGYFFGKSSDLFGRYAIILVIVAVVVILLFYRYINSDEIVREVEN